MSHSRLLALDIETVPDRVLLPAPETGEKESFPKPIHHRVVAIGFVLASIVREGRVERYEIEEVRCGGTANSTEMELLRGFWSMVEREKPRLVTWNGRGFDMPVLVQRAFVHGVPMRRWHQSGDRWNSYRYRYALDWNCDLMDALGEHGVAPKLSLQDTAVAVGLPGKIGGHGSEVEQAVAEGRIEDVRAYCKADVLNLAGLYFRWAYVTGRTDAEGHDAAVASMMRLLASTRAERPHLGEFLDRWSVTQKPVFAVQVKPALAAVAGEGEHLPSESVLP